MKDLLKRIGRWSIGSEEGRPGPRQVVFQRDIDEARLMSLGRECAVIITGDPKDVMFTRTPEEALNAVEGVMVLARAWKNRDNPLFQHVDVEVLSKINQ